MDERFVQVSPGAPLFEETTFPGRPWTREDRFLEDARRYHVIEGDADAQPVPFWSYSPTFEEMSSYQLRWYFHWRSGVRRGELLPTPEAYLSLYASELIFMVETPDPREAAEKLLFVWKNTHRTMWGKVPWFPEWAGDLLAVTEGVQACLDWWRDRMAPEGERPPLGVLNTLLQQALDAGKVGELPYLAWSTLNLYRPANHFYETFNRDGWVDDTFRRAILAVDAFLRTQKGAKGLLERNTSSHLLPQGKSLFPSALVPHEYPRALALGEARNFSGSHRLAKLLAAITRYTENLLRQQKHFRGRVGVPDLDEALRHVLDETFASKPPSTATKPAPAVPIEVKLDPERVARLRVESEMVSSLLAPPDGDGVDPTPGGSSLAPLASSAEPLPEDRAFTLGMPATTSSPAAGEDSWARLLATLTPAEEQLLALLTRQGRLEPAELEACARANGAMGGVLLDALAEKGLDSLGHNLFYFEGDTCVIEEEDLPALRHALAAEEF